MKKGYFTSEPLKELVYEGFKGVADVIYFTKETVELILNDTRQKWIYENETDSYYLYNVDETAFVTEVFSDLVETEDGKQKLYFFDGWEWKEV